MPEVSVTTRTGAPEETAADTRVVGLFEGESLPDPELQQLVDLGEAKGSLKKVAVAHEDAPGGGRRRVLIAGLGKRDEFDHETARVAAASAAGRAQEVGAVSLSWAAPNPESAGPLVEGTLLSLYKFDRFKSSADDEDNEPDGLESLELAGEDVAEEEVERARTVATAQNRARDLQNLPGNVATPIFLGERAGEIADQFDNLEVELLDREAIVGLGMGAFEAVARGSYHRLAALAEAARCSPRAGGRAGAARLRRVRAAVRFGRRPPQLLVAGLDGRPVLEGDAQRLIA